MQVGMSLIFIYTLSKRVMKKIVENRIEHGDDGVGGLVYVNL